MALWLSVTPALRATGRGDCPGLLAAILVQAEALLQKQQGGIDTEERLAPLPDFKWVHMAHIRASAHT